MARGRAVDVPLFSKAPFANYDLVVYLGGGFFSLLVVWRYIVSPFGIFDLSAFSEADDQPWTIQIIYITILLVISYIVGHLVAYLSSYFIEGFFGKTLGKFSKVIKQSTCPYSEFQDKIRKEIVDNRRENFPWTSVGKIPYFNINLRLRKKDFFLWLFHQPVRLWYALVAWRGYFRFADSRLPSRMFEDLDKKLDLFFDKVDTNSDKQWFRWIEYYTSYNAPVAASSMYNYLVISGFMRSLAFMFLVAFWFELLHLGIFLFSQVGAFGGISKISHGSGGFWGHALYFIVIFIGYVCTATSYFKFFRRYVEEAVMGFLLEVPPKPQ